MRSLRVLSLDVDRLRGRRAAVLRVLRETAPDVACLHRVPTHEFSGHRLGTLAADAGLLVAVGGRPCGVAVLTALRVDVPLTWTRRRGRGSYALAGVRPLGASTTWVAALDVAGDPRARAALAGELLADLAARAGHPGEAAKPAVAPLLVSAPLTAGDPAAEVLLGTLSEVAVPAGSEAPGAAGVAQGAGATRLGLLSRDVAVSGLPLPGEIGRHPEHLRFVGPLAPVVAEVDPVRESATTRRS